MANKLLLVKDVESLGRSGDIVSVRPGYARNFLVPMGFAVIADRNGLRKQARLQEERAQQAIADRQESDEVAARLNDQTVTTIVKVDHDGHMYGSVNVSDILHLLQEQLSVTLERKAVQLKQPIKELGDHAISIKLKEGVVATINLSISPDVVVKKAHSKKEVIEKAEYSSEES